MASLILALAGTAVLLLDAVEIFKTALTLQGAGPVTSRLSAALWRALLRLHRRTGAAAPLVLGGPAIAAATVIGWLLLQWIGWSLIFAAGMPVVASRTGETADVWGLVYFIGYTLSTLGLGDYQPVGPLWQMLTAVASGAGFLTISLAAAYLIPVISAAAQKRQLAIYIDSLGSNPAEILAAGWNGRDFSVLAQHLTALTPSLIQVAEQHLAYPILHYFHSGERRESLITRVAALGEAVHLLTCAVRPETRPIPGVTRPVERGLDTLVAYIGRAQLDSGTEIPPPPSLEPLRAAGIPLVDEASFQAALAQAAKRRKLMLALVRDGGWRWSDVWQGPG